ncbi:hypothetical protein FGIG_08842 [Fasciola gigantica]|uniref:Uncharacterized protein n=1 Tax=Fasciola gigantica TaxID=46835 RepID=A0A504WT25_FASGI|nr:hypothetical protein FGIG_08842 [Fasciola gigantica]
MLSQHKCNLNIQTTTIELHCISQRAVGIWPPLNCLCKTMP